MSDQKTKATTIPYVTKDFPSGCRGIGIACHVWQGVTPPAFWSSVRSRYPWTERGNIRKKCLAQEHNGNTPVSAPTQGPARTIRPAHLPENNLPAQNLDAFRRLSRKVKYLVLTKGAFHLVTFSGVQLVAMAWQPSILWSWTVTTSYPVLDSVAAGFVTGVP